MLFVFDGKISKSSSYRVGSSIYDSKIKGSTINLAGGALVTDIIFTSPPGF